MSAANAPLLGAQAWARHLAGPAPQPSAAGLTAAEAARVQRYRDQLAAALQRRDRGALHSAKQQVLDAAFRPCDPHAGPGPDSPALRRALRDLCWRMAALLLPRRPLGD